MINSNKKFSEILLMLKSCTDALGKPIDEQILQLVAILNYLGIPTIQSCEGHLDHGIAAPWIDIGVKNVSLFNITWKKARTVLQNAQLTQDIPEKQLLIQKSTVLFSQARKMYYREANKLFPFLNHYYSEYNPAIEHRLIITDLNQCARLHFQGDFLQETATNKKKAANLKTFQYEIDRFTQFLFIAAHIK
jgi:hypothetical protein